MSKDKKFKVPTTEAEYFEMLPIAVCALIYRGDKMVGVSRRDNHKSMGLVGGKVDAGETPEEALVREVFEETGLKVTSFEKIFTRIDGVFICYTYLCQADGEISNQNEVGKDSGIGKVAEVTWEDLFAGPFGDYNKQLYTHLNSK